MSQNIQNLANAVATAGGLQPRREISVPLMPWQSETPFEKGPFLVPSTSGSQKDLKLKHKTCNKSSSANNGRGKTATLEAAWWQRQKGKAWAIVNSSGLRSHSRITWQIDLNDWRLIKWSRIIDKVSKSSKADLTQRVKEGDTQPPVEVFCRGAEECRGARRRSRGRWASRSPPGKGFSVNMQMEGEKIHDISTNEGRFRKNEQSFVCTPLSTIEGRK